MSLNKSEVDIKMLDGKLNIIYLTEEEYNNMDKSIIFNSCDTFIIPLTSIPLRPETGFSNPTLVWYNINPECR